MEECFPALTRTRAETAAALSHSTPHHPAPPQTLRKGTKPQYNWVLQTISFGSKANFLANPV